MVRDSMFLGRKNQYCENDIICRFSVIPMKLSMAFFKELEQKISHSNGNSKDPI